ncbi:hypothetical protein JCM11641_000786 [Rhodosporidiobolus odoratus]
MDNRRRPIRVAVVGTGLAGLATAYRLQVSDARYHDGSKVAWEVHLIEKNERLGMDAASLSVKTEDGVEVRVDVPMRSINGGSHSYVKRLYDHLGVPLIRSDFSYSFSTLSSLAASTPSPDFASRPRPSSEYGTLSVPSTPATPPPPYSDSDSATVPLVAFPDSRSASTSTSQTTTQTTELLYSGASGLSWPPLPFPSHLSTFPSQLSHLVSSILFTVSYLYLLVLAFFYVSLSLSQPPPPVASTSPTRNSLASTLRRRFVQHFGVAAEPLDRWMSRHLMPGSMQELVRTLMAAVATINRQEAGKMPVGEILEYITSTFTAPHYLTSPSFGVRGIVSRLVAPIPPSQIHLGVCIKSLFTLANGRYGIRYSRTGGKGEKGNVGRDEVAEEGLQQGDLEVDHIVFATQADQAATLLSLLASSTPALDPSPRSRPNGRHLDKTLAALRSFTYTQTTVVTHTDSSLLPPAPRDRKDLNLAVVATRSARPLSQKIPCSPESGVQTTHILRSLLPSSSAASSPMPRLLLQTTNPLISPSPFLTLSSTTFTRCVVNPSSQNAVPLFSRLVEEGGVQGLSLPSSLSGGRTSEGEGEGEGGGEGKEGGGIWFVGSYAAPGIPLLEGCVESAEGVVGGLIRRETYERPRGSR